VSSSVSDSPVPQATGPLSTGRVIGLDLGTRRIGVAVSDGDRRVASAFTVLVRRGTVADDHARIARAVAETEANLVVVGWPLSLSGRSGPAARAVEDEVGDLRAILTVPVELCDERFTTVVVNRALTAQGRRSAGRRKVVDKMAAAVILQTWLDRHSQLDRQSACRGATRPVAGSASP
jgi:putative holliday junction resolvase